MTDNKEIMARNILKYMDKMGVNATEICNALSIKQNTFSDWVNAKTYPRIDAIEAMAKYFGISKAYLVEEVSDLVVFTEEDKILIELYHKADKGTQEAINRLLAYYKSTYENKVLSASDIPALNNAFAARQTRKVSQKIIDARNKNA